MAKILSFLALEDKMSPAIAQTETALAKAAGQMDITAQKVEDMSAALEGTQAEYDAIGEKIMGLSEFQSKYEDALNSGASTIEMCMESFDKYGVSITAVGEELQKLDAESVKLAETLGAQEIKLQQLNVAHADAQSKTQMHTDKLFQQNTALDKAAKETINAAGNIKKMTSAQLEDYKAALQHAIAVESNTNKLKDYEKQLGQVEDQLGKSSGNAAQGFESMAGKITAAAAAMQLFQMATGAIRKVAGIISDMTDASQKHSQANAMLASTMRRTQSATDDNIISVINYSKELQGQGVISQTAILSGTQQVAALMKTEDEYKAILPAMTDMIAARHGLNATEEDAASVGQALAQALQGNTGALQKQGVVLSKEDKELMKIGSREEKVARLTELVTDRYGGMNEALLATPSGQIKQLETSFQDLQASVGEVMLGIEGAFAQGFLAIFGDAEAVVGGIRQFIIDNADAIVKGIIVLGAAIAVIATVMFVSWMMANLPIVMLVTGIMLLVAAVAGSEATISDVMGAIVGIFDVACAVIWDIGIGVFDALIQAIWTIFVDPIIGIVEFVLNVLGGGFDSFGEAVKNLVGQIISWFLSLGEVVTKIVDAIFGTNWTAGLESLKSDVLAWGKNENAITLDRGAPTANSLFGVERKAYGEAWDEGNEFGRKIGDGIQEGLDNFVKTLGEEPNIGVPPGGEGDYGDFNFDEVTTSTGGGGGGKAMKTKEQGEIKISSEQIKMLHDIAKRTFEITYQQVEPKVSVTIGTVNQKTDVKEMVNMIADGIEAASSSKLVIAKA